VLTKCSRTLSSYNIHIYILYTNPLQPYTQRAFNERKSHTYVTCTLCAHIVNKHEQKMFNVMLDRRLSHTHDILILISSTKESKRQREREQKSKEKNQHVQHTSRLWSFNLSRKWEFLFIISGILWTKNGFLSWSLSLFRIHMLAWHRLEKARILSVLFWHVTTQAKALAWHSHFLSNSLLCSSSSCTANINKRTSRKSLPRTLPNTYTHKILYFFPLGN
jgi:hypothetical protein